MKSELAAVTRRDSNQSNTSAILQECTKELFAKAARNQRSKSCRKVSKKKCKLSIPPNCKGFKKIPKIQHRCSSILTVKNQALLIVDSSNNFGNVGRNAPRVVTGEAKPGRITKSRSNQTKLTCSSSFAEKTLMRNRKNVKRSPLRSPKYSPMKDAFEKHHKEAAAFMKLKSSEIYYLKVTVYPSESLYLKGAFL